MCSEKGQTLLELIVVISVSVIIIGALVFATIASLRNAQFSKNQSLATKLAQEGIERVRVGRDRNQCIKNLDAGVNSWNGSSTNSDCPGSGSIWNYPITGSSSNCENLTTSGKCYFTGDSFGVLTMVGYSQTTFPASLAESIPPFKRLIILSDDLNENGIVDDDPQNAKKITSVVQWTDFSGTHESRLTTILRRL